MKLIKCETLGLQQYVEKHFADTFGYSENKRLTFAEFNEMISLYSEYKELDSVDLTY